MKYIATVLFLILLFPIMGRCEAFNGQAVSIDGQPIPNAFVQVCSGWSDNIIANPAIPCTKYMSPATVYANAELTSATNNPLNADINGAYHFFVIPGKYTLTIWQSGFAAHSEEIDEACGPVASGNTSCGFADYTWDANGNIIANSGVANGTNFSIIDKDGNHILDAALDGSEGVNVVYLFSTYGVETGNGDYFQVDGASGTQGIGLTVNGSNTFDLQYGNVSNGWSTALSMPTDTNTPTMTFNVPVNFASTINGIHWSSGSGAPSGSCTAPAIYMNTAGTSGSAMYDCVAGAWKDIN